MMGDSENDVIKTSEEIDEIDDDEIEEDDDLQDDETVSFIRDLPVYDENGEEIPESELSWENAEVDPHDASHDWEYDDEDDRDDDPDDDADDEDDLNDEYTWQEEILGHKLQRPKGLQKIDQSQLTVPQDNRSAAERRKRVSKAVREEALRRLEEAARTTADFQLLTQTYDREEQSRMRKERRHENLSEDPYVKTKHIFDGIIFPRWLGTPLQRQLNRGQFDDYLADCYFTMHDLTAKEHLRSMILQLKPEHREIVFFLYIRLYSAQLLAKLRGQTDRNIRKVRDTVRRKLWRLLYAALTELQKQGVSLTHQEQQFLKTYVPRKKEAEDDEPV